MLRPHRGPFHTPGKRWSCPSGQPRPAYPPIAVSARVSGEVEVKIGVRPDGTVESAVIVRDVPLLASAALEAAQKSQFECRGCSEPVTPYVLLFAFRLDEPTSPVDLQQKDVVSVTASQGRVTIVAEPPPFRYELASLAIRSPKCLWLWRCGSHWTGLDRFYYRVRSGKCLWLWECGYERRDSHRPIPNSRSRGWTASGRSSP